jgi:cyclohexa-1,5-dienecarbonyl-CoA hydratase
MSATRVDPLYEGQVLRLTLSRYPGNSIDRDLVEELYRAVDEHAGDPRLKLILFAGAGADFAAGSELDTAEALARFHALLLRLLDSGVPTAACVRGRCRGAGFDLAAFCNFIFATASAEFGQNAIGHPALPPPSSLILPLKLGHARSFDLVLLAQPIDGIEAYRRGLVTAVAQAPEDLSALVKAWVTAHILPKSARSLRLANRAARLAFSARLRAELPALERLYVTALGAEKPVTETERKPPRSTRPASASSRKVELA